METGGGVDVGWSQDNGQVEVRVRDEGPGLANTANLFVPFFTTKAKGSGIGLVLSRQIAEAHGGTLTLENRSGTRGCEALLRLQADRGKPADPQNFRATFSALPSRNLVFFLLFFSIN